MQLVVINSQLVEDNEDNYNSNFHTAKEAPHLTAPSEIPTQYSRWLPLICRSQSIPTETVQTITLTPRQGRLLLDASQASLHTREPNRLLAEELECDIYPIFETLNFGPEGLFLRLDGCSPKDGVRPNTPLKTVEEIVLRITTSHRATNCIIRSIAKNDVLINLFFMPYNPDMRTDKEYRVFCAPLNCQITAISQYRWHKPSILASQHTMQNLAPIIAKIETEAKKIHKEILDEAARGGRREMDALLLNQGFAFDIMWQQVNEKCCLIELNTFGTRSGCGACLFHWLRDEAVLYGNAPAEFRISAPA